MKAVVFKSVGQIAFEEVEEPTIKDPKDAIVAITTSAICGTDLHLIRGTIAGVKPNTILGHEGVGIIEKIGDEVRNFKVGDRVIIPSTVGCGYCQYCSLGIYSQCDNANPHGPDAGTVFYGGPLSTGPFDGLQAEKVRVLFADAMLIKIPDKLSDEHVILLSDILPTSYMAVANADVHLEDSVAVFGCGPVGQLAIACLKEKKVKQIYAIDRVPARLKLAQNQGAHPINFDEKDPVYELKNLTDKNGPNKVIDAVGVDAQQPQCCGLGFFKGLLKRSAFAKEVKEVAPKTNPHDGNWSPGDGPSQVLNWAVQSVAKAGTISIIGVYPPLMTHFLIGSAMGKNLTLRMGNCNHRAYFPMLLDWVKDGRIDLVPFITQRLPFSEVINGYKHFDKREDDWIKVILQMPIK